MKKCPFRKSYIRTNYNLYGSVGYPGFDYEEEFQDCLGEDCMAYHANQYITDDGDCKLMEDK